ncbi:MAG: hypothetical protein JJT75_09870 [Opitutales bacterium]|nr:hypothetical protein [Opitutales bacterium]MCH8541079.1 hypothetical protein [Opitutales bacterium]
MKRSPLISFLCLLMVVVIVAVGSCLVVFYTFILPQFSEVHGTESFIEDLDLSPEIAEQVETIDEQFDAERDLLLVDFRSVTSDLAELLAKEDSYSKDVQKAIDRIHHVHGDLQALSVRRYFAILEILPPNKQQRFRQLAADALSQPE